MTELERYLLVYTAAPLGGGLLLWGLAALGWRRFGRWLAPLWLLGGPLVGIGAMVAFFLARPHPEPTTRTLFDGIEYARYTRAAPVPLVWHEVRLDLSQPGLTLFVTPPEPIDRWQVRARTTTGFLAEFGAQLAVNASFYYEQRSSTLLVTYPRVGDPVSVVGPAVAGGAPYTPPSPANPHVTSLHWWPDPSRAAITAAATDAPEVVSGYPLLEGGELRTAPILQPDARHPRVAVGLEPGGRVMWWIVTDGRQPRYSEGTTVAETAALLRARGVQDALLLDGGGSAALAVEADDGRPALLNTPVHGRLPAGVQRPVANHLGVRISRRPGE